MSNIKSKLIIYFTTLLTIILIILSFVALHSMKISVVNEIEKHLISDAKSSGKIILSRNSTIYTYLEGIACHKNIFDSGKTITEKVKLLQKEAEKSDHFLKIGFSDTEGNLYLEKNYIYDKQVLNIQEREYFQKSIRGNRGIMTPTKSINPYDKNNLVMIYSVPIYDKEEIVGVLVGITDAWILSDLFNDIKFGESGYAYILDSTGTAISHPIRKNVISQINPIEKSKVDPSFKSVAEILSLALKNNYGAGEYKYLNKSLYMGYSKISGLDWLVVVTANKDEVLQDLFAAQNNFFVVSFILLIFSISIYYCVGQSVFNKEKFVTNKFNIVFENNPALMAIQTFPELRITECNQVFFETLGYSLKELSAKSKKPSRIRLSNDIIEKLHKNLKVSNEEVRLITKHGKKIDCIYSGELFEYGNKKYLLSVYVDISDKKAAEKELILAKEHAESANVLKGQFLANMSHEIRTPINGVIGYIKLLEEYTNLTNEQKEYILGAKESSEILLGLIEDILDLSKIEAGKLQFEHIEFSIRELLQTSVKVIMPRINEKNLDIILNISDGLPDNLIGDPLRISQVINNLLSNAVKFTSVGSISLNVDFIKKSHSVVSVIFSIIDSGIGIPADKIDLIFENFVQADSSTKRKYGGTGLGLSISKQLVEQMGGIFKIQSELNKGSIFSFEIPLDISDKTKLNIKTLKDYEQIYVSNIKYPRILLVEDNRINQKIFTAFLKKKSLTCDIAEDGMEAVEKIRANDYDIVFMDCNLPVLDGFEATELIRKIHPRRKEVIIAVTASAMEGDRDICIAAGMDDYISKPINLDQLFEMIYKYGISR